MSTAPLLSLDEETWGERVGRARTRARISLKEASARVSRLVPVSYSTLMRLESLPEPPADIKRRLVAYLALSSYGYEPEAFGLSSRDLPRWMTSEKLSELRSDLVSRRNCCFAESAA